MKTSLFALVLALTPLVAQDRPQPVPDVIVLPDCAHVLAPSNVPKVTGTTLYVFSVPKDCLVLTSPPGLATVVKEAAPLKIKGQFIDSTGIVTRTFGGKWVYQIDPVPGTAGRIEVIVIPVGTTDEKLVARKLVDVDGGGSPTPPIPPPGPTPPPNPGPAPVPVPSVPMTGIVFIEETDAAQTARNTFLNDPAFVARRQAKGIKFRTADKDVVGPDGKPPADLVEFLNAAKAKAYPQVFFVGYNNGKRVTLGQFDLPKTIPALLDLMSKYGG